MRLATFLRRTLVFGIVASFFGTSWVAVITGDAFVVAAGATIYVDDNNTDGPWDGTVAHPYQNITSGLEYASHGDTVFVFNGTYNEPVVLNKSTTLRGESKPIISASTGPGIYIDVTSVFAYGVTVEGFEILSASSYGIELHLQNIQDLNNAAVNIGDIVVADNTIDSLLDGVLVDVSYIGSHMYGNSTLMMGDLRIEDNEINSHNGNGIVLGLHDVGYRMYDRSSLSMGNLKIANNTVDSPYDGMNLDFEHVGYEMYSNSSFSIGDIAVKNNSVESGSIGIHVYEMYEFGYSMYDNASFKMGNTEFDSNRINSLEDGFSFNHFLEFGYQMYNSSSFTMGSFLVDGNVINSSAGEGISIDHFGSFGYLMFGSSSFEMGNIECSRNAINSVFDGINVLELDFIGFAMSDHSSFTMGNILFNSNVINSTDGDGVSLFNFEYFGSIMIDASSFIMGNVEISDNSVNSNTYGISIDLLWNFGYYMLNRSVFAMGDIRINDNVINSGSDGIWIGYINGFCYATTGTSSFKMGNVELSGNIIVSSYNGIHITEFSYFGTWIGGNSSFTMNSIIVNKNTITSTGPGILVDDMYAFGQENYGNSSFMMNNAEFCSNTVDSTTDAVSFGAFRDFGIYMYDNSSFSMGSVLVNDNTFYSYLWLGNFGTFGSNLYGNASFTMNNVEFNRNMIHSIGKAEDGIYFSNFLPFGYEMHSNSSFTMGDFNVNSNTIVGNGDRFGIACFAPSGEFGINLYDSASALTGNFEFAGNDISFTQYGIYLYRVTNAIIRNNTVRNSTYIGIYLLESADNTIYHNNFINSTFLQAEVTTNYNNTWDNGYPSGGNYWSDYTGTDQYSGPDQDIAGSDFRGDTPYIINTNNTDHYPLTIPYETQPPTIVILSPENTTYAVETDIQLTFTLNEPVEWIGYSLNDQAVVTIAGNTTLPTLPVGSHHVTVYANDTFNNMGNSVVYFTVLDMTDPVANAGSDRTVNEDAPMTLDGSASTDNVGITSYTWAFTDVTVKTLTEDKPTYTFNNPGVYTITLNVTDAAGNWATDTVVITVSDITNPVPNAGEDQTVNVGDTVTFDAGSSTDNVGITSYTWAFTDVTVKTLTGDKPTYTFNNPGVYTVTLNVTDAAGNWATDTVIITVLDVTDPVANVGQDQTVNVGDTVAFDAGSSTDNVGIVSYEWDFGDETSGTGKTTTHAYTSAGTYTVTLTVKDAAGNEATDTMVVTVNPIGDGFPWGILAAVGIIAVGVAVAAMILWRRRRKT